LGVFGTSITAEAVCVLKEGTTKHEALEALVAAIADTGAVRDTEAFGRAVFDREAIMSTGIGQGIAIPHVRIDAVEKPTVGVAVSTSGVDFDTLDNEPVHIIVIFAMPAGSQKDYLGLLAKVMVALKVPGFPEKLLACTAPEEVAAVLTKE
jgi:fructose-specific phosphotransferase system IIA component